MTSKPSPTRPEPGWLTKKQMVSSCGVTPTAFDKWGIQPVARIGRNAYFTVSDVISNRLARQAMNAAADAGKKAADASPMPLVIEAEREKLLLTREQRIGQELKNAQTRRELAPVGLIEWTLSRIGGQIAAHLESIPLNVKKRNPGLPARAIEDVKREVVKAQNMAARVTVDLDEYYERDPEGD